MGHMVVDDQAGLQLLKKLSLLEVYFSCQRLQGTSRWERRDIE